MKRLTCELCGGTDIVKEEGAFVCQSCGMKYSVEEAKKMMAEAPDDGMPAPQKSAPTSTNSSYNTELNNLYELARRAKNDGNSENAQKYYEQIIVKDPSSWEANFYSVYYQSMNCKIAGIQSAAIRLSNCEDTVLELIRDHVTDPDERRKAVDEVAAKLITISRMLFNAAKNHYDGIGYQIKSNYTQEYLNNCCAARDILYNYGDYLIKFFGDEYGKNIAVPCWKVGIEEHMVLMPNFANKELNKTNIEGYAAKIKKYDESYDASGIEAVPNIHFIGPVAYQELPQYAAKFDVCTIPFVVNSITNATSPLKLFEYMALRKPVLTTAMKESSKYAAVNIATGAEEFAQKLQQLLAYTPENQPAYFELLDKIVDENAWEAKADLILDMLAQYEASV